MKTRRKIYEYAVDDISPPTKRRKMSEAAEDTAAATDGEGKKKKRASNSKKGAVHGGKSLAAANIGCLPPEVWALSLEFLLYKEVLDTCLVSKAFVREVTPRVTRLCIMNPQELHLRPTYRFQNVTVVNMFCLVECTPGNCNLHRINADAASRVTPFLSRFPKLEESNLLGLCEHDPDDSGWFQYDAETCASDQQGRPIMTSLIHSLCGGFRSGLLGSGVKAINGPSCPRKDPADDLLNGHPNPNPPPCEHCRMMCRAFPLDTVIFWQHHGSEEGLVEPFADFYNGLCLTSTERLETIASRPGGRKRIENKAKDIFEHLLTCVSKGPAENADGTNTPVYFYNEAVLSDVNALSDFLYKNHPSGFRPSAQVHRLLNSRDVLDCMWEGIEMHQERKEGGERPLFSKVAIDELHDVGVPVQNRAFRLLDYKEALDKWVYLNDDAEPVTSGVVSREDGDVGE
mmetsp:Transcript_15327/g.44351  ORF Transcript_15327/g.44351 Transcript_15327/m.44351 type:complete len:458 (+) Transcript_15327:308-1681(+)